MIEAKRWTKDKVAKAICRVVIRQNFCDENGIPLLVLDKGILNFLRWKYWLSYRRVWQLKNWAKENGLISIHPGSPTTLTPDNAHMPDIYIINQEFYDNEIKPHLKEAPSIY